MLIFLKNKSRLSLTKIVLSLGLVILSVWPAWGNMEAAPPAVDVHLQGIASFTKPSPMVPILAGWFLMGTNREDLNRHSFESHYDNTEFPQRRIWLDTYQIDQYEVSLGEFLRFLLETDRPVSPELRALIWHLISIHFIPDQALAPWPALYLTWEEAQTFCLNQSKRLPSEAEWEKAAKGDNDWRFAWGDIEPTTEHANFNQISWRGESTLVQVGIYEKGKSPYGIYDVAGNVWEWVADWYKVDYYQQSPTHNPKGPETGTHKAVRSSGWQGETPQMRVFTRIPSLPTDRNNSTGFRCAQDIPTPATP